MDILTLSLIESNYREKYLRFYIRVITKTNFKTKLILLKIMSLLIEIMMKLNTNISWKMSNLNQLVAKVIF